MRDDLHRLARPVGERVEVGDADAHRRVHVDGPAAGAGGESARVRSAESWLGTAA